ncbi:MAG: bifunctional 4-hydroxy-2-oxoglutarate aldolase/2-dehydro-3-deoxy-phosphogluconate aldolase [Puniceicoccaceae bacterium]|jgi:2-dehydro-3-deoxyphosphogluconate aldolase / (4S)-4-hydroxy-2-oxoglutarate aldolase|nr:bifunctional 4-hydroxy-2-oxoglutarate aldolase/2-dehydro-3-deoxy-phosphogluconate aldolase [Puniceicoccaceae bacterium]MBL6838740.1 bifunctional 4-hydroxy-2-oxoglutarate aldolase/2-dehydro-3-deoxy-phosphogluconate aldolase [Puniceicoccaceae bacterium]MBL6912637.1 bifunctional 4-hydroxy-2-oxoglutarate aldolase/2-dehydro-3-deoxy-phosphogluconate aldolase [Puniceicoccaceae bacterium]
MSSLHQFPVIPVIVLEDANDAVPLAEALLAGGLNIIEVTFRTEAAAESIERITKAFPEMQIGAGTVVTPEQAKRAIDAGSKFGLAPGTDPETIAYFKAQGVPFIPGIMTPSDIQAAIKAGCTSLKFFPAGAAGGPELLKAMAAPYVNLGVQFCPTGGVSIDNMNDYLSMPEVFAIGGSWLATKRQIQAKDWATITQQVKEALAKAAV